jgi:hypothetical protein
MAHAVGCSSSRPPAAFFLRSPGLRLRLQGERPGGTKEDVMKSQSWIVVAKESGKPLMLQGWPLTADTEEKAKRLLELYVAHNRQAAYAVSQVIEAVEAMAS